MDMKYDKSAKQCVNCPGRTDHETADCPVMHYGTLDPQQRLDVARGEQPQASAAQSSTKQPFDGCTINPGPVEIGVRTGAAQSAPAGEREAAPITDEELELVQTFAGELQGMYCDGSILVRFVSEFRQLRAAWQRTQSAGVPEGWRELLERCLDRWACCSMAQVPGAEQAWNELRAMLAAAPAQGQQVECKECERLRERNKLLSGPEETVTVCENGKPYSFMAKDPRRYSLCEVTYAEPVYALIKERDQFRAELAVLKARQVGQEPVAIANKGDHAFWVKWTDAGKDLRGPGIKLYTAPQPAPAQDVAGLPYQVLFNAIADATEVSGGKGHISISVQAFKNSLAAAHEKQSGGEV